MHHECLPFALQPTGSWYCRPMDEPAAVPVEVAVRGRLSANDSDALRDASLAGLGIALLPTWLIADDLRAGRLVAVLSNWEWRIAPGEERAIWAVYPPKKIVSPKVKAFFWRSYACPGPRRYLQRRSAVHLGQLIGNTIVAYGCRSV